MKMQSANTDANIIKSKNIFTTALLHILISS
ncbi:hypothetical protein ACO22_08173 [Paracoccidioides brasiliensis]|uniref:Uncharacterized protein n=1 Tax=Paracoccidioides brasiliensis TaxID=121759 RepID=A0A1D2J2K7_PARBR|nr:hypothetical protein ACO22_08173 [Paracoccidioides brasiliensis]